MVIKNICILVLKTKVALALEGLTYETYNVDFLYCKAQYNDCAPLLYLSCVTDMDLVEQSVCQIPVIKIIDIHI